MSEQQKKFISHLTAFASSELRWRLVGKLTTLLLILGFMGLSVLLADQVFYFSGFTRAGLLVINTLILILLVRKLVWKALSDWLRFRKSRDLLQACHIAENYRNNGSNRLLVAGQLILEQVASGADDLRSAAIESIIRREDVSQLSDTLKPRNFFPSFIYMASLLISALILTTSSGGDLWQSAQRLLDPLHTYTRVPDFQFTVQPGDSTVIKGQSLVVRAKYSGPKLSRLLLVNPLSGKLAFQVQNDVYRIAMEHVRAGFEYHLEGVPKDARYSGTIISPVYKIRVVEAPEIQVLDAHIIPPSYTGLPEEQLERNVGDLNCLAGTRADIRIKTNKVLAAATIQFKSGRHVPLKLRGQAASGKFEVQRDDSYEILLEDTSGISNQSPIQYFVNVIRDLPPLVHITEPGRDMELPLDGQLALQIEAEDDYGISGMYLNYRIQNSAAGMRDTSWAKHKIPIRRGQIVKTAFQLDFNRLALAFGDTLQYFARAWDNNSIGGRQQSSSVLYQVFFPSINEMFEQAQTEQDAQKEGLDELRRESQSLQHELEKLEREMRRAKELDWQQKQALSQAAQRQQKAQQKLEELKEKLKQTVDKMQQNNLLSPQLLEKYQKLQQLFEQILPQELKDALQKLQQAIDKANPNQVRQALKQFRLNQQAFEENIERTAELLKRVQFEQQMDQLVQKAQQLLKQQKKISNELQAAGNREKADSEQLARRQKQQKELLKNLQRDLGRMQQNEMLRDFEAARRSLDSAATNLNDDKLNQAMESSSQQIQVQQFSMAQQTSQQIQKKTEQALSQLKQAQKSMLQQEKQNIAEKMQRLENQMLRLSIDQEQIRRQTQATSPLGDNFNEVQRQQGRIQQNFRAMLQDLMSLGRQTFFLPPQLNKSLANAARKMEQSQAQLSERNKNGALSNQAGAMRALNDGALTINESRGQMMQSSSGTGFEEFLQRMQQMAGQQGQLNQESMQMMQGQGEKPMFGPGQQGRLRGMGARQAALRKAMEELGKQMGQRDDVMGGLEHLAEEMKKVEKDLLSGQMDRRTVDRQQKILSRMLDAQHSLEQRQYSQKRKAEQAKSYLAIDPGRLKKGIDPTKQEIEAAMQAALREGYQKEYQKLIRAYFEKLLRAKSIKN